MESCFTGRRVSASSPHLGLSSIPEPGFEQQPPRQPGFEQQPPTQPLSRTDSLPDSRRQRSSSLSSDSFSSPGRGTAATSAQVESAMSASADATPASLPSTRRCLSRGNSCPRSSQWEVVGTPEARGSQLHREASYRETNFGAPTSSSTPMSRVQSLRSYGEASISTADTSPLHSPSHPSSPAPRTLSLPYLKVMSEADARLVFKSLVEAVSKSRRSAGPTGTSEGTSSEAVWAAGAAAGQGCSQRGASAASGSGSHGILFGSCNKPCCRPLTFAPEMLVPEAEGEGAGDLDLDQLEIWSLGILLYRMLRGREPFKGKSREHTRSLILACRLRFPLLSWQTLTLSQEAKELMRWVLALRPSDRPTIDQVLSHPWVTRPFRRR